MGTHVFSAQSANFEVAEVRDAMMRPFEDDEAAEVGYARVISRSSTVRVHLPKTPLRDIYETPDLGTTSHLARTQSHIRPATTSASAGNILQPISINKHHNRTNTTYSTYLPERSLSIMDRGRPVRKSSASCWPGVGRELGTKPAEEWKRDKEGRTSSVADLHFR